MNKNVLLLILSFLVVLFSCQNNELLTDNNNEAIGIRAAKETYQYSAEKGWVFWKCNLVSGQTNSFAGGDNGCIEMFLDSPIKLLIPAYYGYWDGMIVNNPIVEDVAGVDAHATECGAGYATLYSIVSGEDLLNVWLEGQDWEHPFQILCYVFDPDSYSLYLNESKTTLVISPLVMSRSIKYIASIEIMTYDKKVLFAQTYTERIRNIGVNIASFSYGKYIVKIKDDMGGICYQRLIIE